MVRKGIISSVLLFLAAGFANGQDILLNYEWEDDPKVHELTEVEAAESSVFIKHSIGVEVFYSDQGSPFEYFMGHSLVHLNDAEAVDNNNKVYMPGSNIEGDYFVTVEKARVIKPDGTVIELDQEDILEEVNEEEGVTYRYFALEGVEVGDELEYIFIYPRYPRLYGSIQRMQTGEFKREATVTIITPSNLENRYSSLNGFPEMIQDSSYDENYFTATATNLPGLDSDESFSSYNASRAGVAYYLYKNTYNGKTFDYYTRISSSLATIFENIDTKKSGVDKLIKNMDIDDSWSDEEKIIYVENYAKKNFVYVRQGIEGLGELSVLTKKKVGNDLSFLMLFGAIFEKLDIKYEIVYTCDRNDYTFQENFKCQLFVQEALFYFPDTEKYMSPVGINTRYGFPPAEYTNTHGLFTRFVTIGGNRAGVGKVKYIDAVSADATSDEFTITLDFDDLPNTHSTITRELSGYNALTYQFIFDLVDDETLEEIEESLVNYIDEDMDLGEIKVSNKEEADFGKKPLKIEADFESTLFVKKAGNNYLINVGKMIGPQAELYQENPREMAVSNHYNRKYTRKLIVNVPEGYELANLENLEMDVRFDKDGKKDMGFISTYELEGNTLTVLVEEYYYTIDYPIEEYDKFEKQINAAADFNKVAILLKKI